MGLLALFLGLLLVAAWPLGIWLARLSSGNIPGWMQRVEAPLYRLAGTSAKASMNWSHYALAVLAFNALGVLMVYALQRLQVWLPLNPAGMAAVSPDSAFNTALSFRHPDPPGKWFGTISPGFCPGVSVGRRESRFPPLPQVPWLIPENLALACAGSGSLNLALEALH